MLLDGEPLIFMPIKAELGDPDQWMPEKITVIVRDDVKVYRREQFEVVDLLERLTREL